MRPAPLVFRRRCFDLKRRFEALDRRSDLVAVELAARRAEWQPSAATPARGYYKLYVDHVLQADQGADFDFLVGRSGTDEITTSEVAGLMGTIVQHVERR